MNDMILPMTGKARSELIRRARRAKGLTQRELGEQVGLPQSTISQIETGDILVDLTLLPRIAAVLDIGGQALHRLLEASDGLRWRAWVWASNRPPNQKLVLLALTDGADGQANLAQLEALTGLNTGTLRAAVEELARVGLLHEARDRLKQGEPIIIAGPSPGRCTP
ncbi:transcriptional regulator, y4mF family [Thiorhodovibrio litoralis]|nr:transcription factor, MBF1 [Thiorhodovibrio winogradskyi]WPL12423.1 transcriptional regulator, y4mF family [Thiorhodovibrio litoralis]